VIMNNEAMVDLEREVDVFRGDRKVTSGDDFVPGETLAVTLSDYRGQFVFEVSGATFVGGSCGGVRSTKRKVAVVAPEDSTEDIRIWAGWATGQTAVRITPAVVLKSALRVQEEENRARQEKEARLKKEKEKEEEENEKLRIREEYRQQLEREKEEKDNISGNRAQVKAVVSIKNGAHKVRDQLFHEADEIRSHRERRPLERLRADDDDGADDNDAVIDQLRARPAGPLRQSMERPSLGGSVLAAVALMLVVGASVVGVVKFRGKKHYH